MCNEHKIVIKFAFFMMVAVVIGLEARITQPKKARVVSTQPVIQGQPVSPEIIENSPGLQQPEVLALPVDSEQVDQSQSVQPSKIVKPVPVQNTNVPQKGGLALAREREKELQRMRQNVAQRGLGRAEYAKELAKQAERDGLVQPSLQEIIGSPDTKPNRFTQTEAHLSLPFVRELIAKNYKVEHYLDIVSEAIANEAKHRNTHYAFYNTTSNMWRLAQDLDTRLNARLNPVKSKNQFKFLRFEDDFFVNATAQGFLVNELKQKGLVDDNTATGAILLSVNLSLFGNVGFPGECSWQYFVSPQGHKAPWRETYEKMMAKHGLTDKYIDELMKLVDIYATAEDTILQVFIPKDKIDEIGYLAWVKGIPAHGETISFILNNAKSKSFQHVLKPRLENLTAKFAQEQENNPLYAKMMEGIQAGDFSLDAFLKVYCNKPWDLKEINDVTARLLFTPSVLGNPESGVIVIRLSKAHHRKLKEYNDKLNAIIEKMVIEKEAREDAAIAAAK